MRASVVALALLLLAGCSGSARDSLAEAQGALASGQHVEAIAAAEAGLAADPDEVTAWNLELVRLEALARDGRADAALERLDALAAERPDQFPADQYVATADQLRGAGEGGAAIQALDRGLKRFPADAELLAQIEKAKTAPEPGSDELKMLESLGYLDN